ncbi:RsmB/NOP family class I SAM-dependent RNA methyltransferase [Aquisphaera giovannonii]|uniref:hypothetical protein n=1 Tax=Aquisphaera giovannonii TaxID=406548 RepID=UPI001AEFD8BE|nr:hypothetical protein [Aquisphaera giovannonii]
MERPTLPAKAGPVKEAKRPGPGRQPPGAGPAGRPHEEPGKIGVPRVKSYPAVASLTASVAPQILRGVLDTGKRLEPALKEALEGRKETSWSHRRVVTRAIAALLRWWGWIEPLRLVQVEEQLALAWSLDSSEIDPTARIWAEKAGKSRDRMMAAGDAPNWTARAEALKRWVEGKPVTADPWLLFPAWLRDQLAVPPGDAPAKGRRLAFLFSLQSHWPLWVGVRGGVEKTIWNELRDAGHKPWIHRRLTSAAKLDPDTDLRGLRAFQESELAVEDLGSQLVGTIGDPDPGERWWVVHGGNGLIALNLGCRMHGKGTVVATYEKEAGRNAAAARLRRFPWRNIAAKAWDGRRLPAKAGSFDGVVVEPPSSDIGVWRRHPEVRWTVRKDDIPRLAEAQRKLLEVAAAGVKAGGSLIYTVPTVTLAETTELVAAFLQAHPEFRLEPFRHPLEESTTNGTLQVWPHLHDCEARFIARFVRANRPAKGVTKDVDEQAGMETSP